jgi:carbonic anhydrase/acetyltransferase-like protein (isoleucine patch superfamily)
LARAQTNSLRYSAPHVTVSAYPIRSRNQAVSILKAPIMIRPFRGVHPQIHPTAFIEESARVIGDVHIGEHSSVWFNAVVRGDVFYIRIGNRTNIQDGTVIHVTNGTHATILEDEVTIGHNVTLHGCHVERGSLIGIGSIVMDGVRVGAHSLVAAGSLLSPGTQVPARSLVMGQPARVKRPLTDEEVEGLRIFWNNYVGYIRMYKDEPSNWLSSPKSIQGEENA